MSCAFALLQSEQKDLEHSKVFLETELNKVSSELDRANASVSSLKDRADAIKANTEKLQAVIKAGSGWTPDQKLKSKELEEIRDDLRAQLEGKQTTLTALRRDVDALQQHIERGAVARGQHYGPVTSALCVFAGVLHVGIDRHCCLDVRRNLQIGDLY